jgi:integrase
MDETHFDVSDDGLTCLVFAIVGRRDIDDVYTDEELKILFENLVNNELSDLFRVLLKSGLRISKCLALSIDDFYIGEPEHETLKAALNKHGFVLHGYLAIESQLANAVKVRDVTGVVQRKPT